MNLKKMILGLSLVLNIVLVLVVISAYRQVQESDVDLGLETEVKSFDYLIEQIQDQWNGEIPDKNSEGVRDDLYFYNIYFRLKKRDIDFSDVVVKFEVIEKKSLHDGNQGHFWLKYNYSIKNKKTNEVITAGESEERMTVIKEKNEWVASNVVVLTPQKSPFK